MCVIISLFSHNRSQTEIYSNNGIEQRRLAPNVLHIQIVMYVTPIGQEHWSATKGASIMNQNDKSFSYINLHSVPQF